jgi:hypothetical protein
MGLAHSPSVITDGLIYSIDAANTRSYTGSGNTVNGLISGFGGTLVNGVGFSSINNGCFFFDGTNDYINTNLTSSSIGLTSSNFSIGLWAKVKDYSTFNAFVTRTLSNIAAPLDMYILNSVSYAPGYLVVLLGNGTTWNTLQSSSQFPLAWTYLVFTLNSSTMSLYYNAVFNSATALTVPRGESANPIKIGTREDGATYMNGNIGQVQIYNRALSSTEIRQNFNATRKRYGI